MTAIRAARPDERAAVRNVIDGADLSLDPELLDEAFEREAVYVAVSESGVVLGALVCHGEEIAAVAVRPGRRGQGLGTALVAAAAADRERLVAEFDPPVRPFWEALEFDVERLASGRCRGVR